MTRVTLPALMFAVFGSAMPAVEASAGLIEPVHSQKKGGGTIGAKAKAFIGEWVLTLEGGRGPQERTLTISEANGEARAEIAGGRGGSIVVTDISASGNDLVLKWSQGGRGGGAEVPVVMTLTLKDGALSVKQDMAGGQFSQSGTGKKKG